MDIAIDTAVQAETVDVRAWEVEPAMSEHPHMSAIDPGIGTSFDEFIQIRYPEGGALWARVSEAFEATRTRKRRRTNAAEASHFERVNRLLANAMRAHFYRTAPAILYFRKADAERYEDSPSWMRHGALAGAVDGLVDAGLFRAINGKKMPYDSETPSWASSFAATDQLIAMAVECGVTAESIERRLPGAALVRLFEPKARAEFKWHRGGLVRARKGKRIEFESTAETERWTAALAALNAFCRQQDISLGLSRDQLAAWLAQRNADPERTGAPYRLPERFLTDVYRVFNNGNPQNPTFDRGGRLFGGWWMALPSQLRSAITINGSATVELDYSSCHPRMLYHERGLDCVGDLYELAEIAAYEAATGLAPGTYRPCVKWLMQVLINGRRWPNANEKPTGIALPPGFTVKDIAVLAERRHQPIADAFKTGAGLRLMRIESDIALEIVTTAMAEGWVALSVHDSFITAIDQKDKLSELMVQAYVKRLGKEPVLK